MLLADILLISFVGLWAALGLLRGIVKESLGLTFHGLNNPILFVK